MKVHARRQWLMDGDRFALERFVELIAEHPRFAHWEMSQRDILAEAQKPPADLLEAIRCLYRAYARKHGKDRYGDKTPGYALNVRILAELIPESVFVHLIRDGRDVAASLRAVPFGPSQIEECAKYWMARVRAAVDAGERLKGRYLEIRYENLVRAPEVALRSICALAGLKFERAMLDYRTGVEAIIGTTTDPGIHAKLRRELHRARNWREELTKDEARRFEAVAGDLLASLGYRLSGDG